MTRRHYARYVLRRLLALLVLLVVVSFLVFSLLHLAPGDPARLLADPTNPQLDPETIRVIREQYHLDEPFLAQYWIWAKNAVQLDFGQSFETQLPVTEGIEGRLPISIFLGVYAFIITMVIGLLLGILAALRRE